MLHLHTVVGRHVAKDAPTCTVPPDTCGSSVAAFWSANFWKIYIRTVHCKNAALRTLALNQYILSSRYHQSHLPVSSGWFIHQIITYQNELSENLSLL